MKTGPREAKLRQQREEKYERAQKALRKGKTKPALKVVKKSGRGR
jgi:hypothetical protein